MTYTIEGIPVNAQTLMKAYKMWYPLTYEKILNDNKFHFLYLWGIRVDTCDTSLPDDIMGGIRVNRFNTLEIVVSKASTEPTPKNLANLFDAEAVAKGGAAFVKEGEHPYYYYGTNHPKFKPLPAFAPKRPIPVYRWMPNAQDIKDWNKGKGKPLSASFAQAFREGRVKQSTSSDTMIHKTWAKEKLFADSAGCQVMTDDNTLRTLGQWANEHRSMKYPNLFTYTLFTKDQFVRANRTTGTIQSKTGQKSTGSPFEDSKFNIVQAIFNLFRK
jgi:hypothetical protein